MQIIEIYANLASAESIKKKDFPIQPTGRMVVALKSPTINEQPLLFFNSLHHFLFSMWINVEFR